MIWPLALLWLACGGPPTDEAATPHAADQDVTAEVRDRVLGQLSDLHTCYERRLLQTRGQFAGGRIELAWGIAGGRVMHTRVVSDTTDDPEMGACIEETVMRWRFPEEVEGTVVFPFVFRKTRP